MNNAHILGTERIGKLLVQYSIPAIIGMTITSLYNIIDSIFIGHGVGPMGIAGLAITFPLMNLVVAFCTMVSAGGSTISSTHSYSAVFHSSFWMTSCASSVPAMIRCHMPATLCR